MYILFHSLDSVVEDKQVLGAINVMAQCMMIQSNNNCSVSTSARTIIVRDIFLQIFLGLFIRKMFKHSAYLKTRNYHHGC